MKKVFFALSVIGMLSVASCKKADDAKDALKEGVEAGAEATKEGVEAGAEAAKAGVEAGAEAVGVVPTTGNAKVDEFLKSYDVLTTDLSKAVADKDMTKAAELTKKAQEMAGQQASLQAEIAKLPADVQEKLQKYFQAKVEEMMKLQQTAK